MKVLHVNDYRTMGGCEVLIDSTIRLMRERGVESELFSSEDVPGHQRTAQRYIYDRVCRKALGRRIDAFRPDVVHLHNYYHELSPAILGVLLPEKRAYDYRVVMTAHDYHLICPNSGLCEVLAGSLLAIEPEEAPKGAAVLGRRWDHRRRIYSVMKASQHLFNYVLTDRRRAIDLLVCPSRFMERAVARLDLPTMYLPHAAPQAQRRLEKPADRLRWVFAGRVEPEKGLAEFLEMLPREFPGRLTVIGDGSELQRCRAVCRRRGLDDSVEFIGRRPRPETLQIIAASHVAVLPSLCPENAPMSLAEALSLGTNILASNLGGMQETVRSSGVGFLFEPGDARSLAETIGAVAARFDAGDLNAFDASSFLEPRSESAYLEGMMKAYRGRNDAADGEA